MRLNNCSPLFILILLLTIFGQLKGQDDLTSLYYSGAYPEVITQAEERIASGEVGSETWFIKALAEIQLARHSAAVLTLDSALRRYPEDRRFPRALSEQYYRTGQYRDARNSYQALVENDTGDIAAWMRLAEIESFYQDFPRCLLHLDRVLELDSTHLGGLMLAGETLKRHGRDSALVYYLRAWESHPNNQKAAYALANEYIHQKNPKEAITVAEQMLQQDSTSIRFNKLLGFAYYRAGKVHSALDPFQRALDLGTQDHFTYKYKGISHYLAADYSAAIEILGMATTKDSTDAEVEYFLGASLATTKRKEEALAHLERSLVQMQPAPSAVSSIYSEMGNTRRLMGDHEIALDLYTRAWETDTSKVINLYYQASILDNSLSRDKEALQRYEHFIAVLDRQEGERERDPQVLTIRRIVEDRIVLLREELFFRDQD